MTERSFTTPSGVELVYEDLGSGGTPLVLVHGWTGYRQDFETVWDALAQGRRVLAPDLRGHGDSARVGEEGARDCHALTGLVEDLDAFLDAVVGEPCHLLGHSMGGMVALRLALSVPERLASLILMDTSAAPLEHANVEAASMAGKVAREQGTPALAALLRKLESGSTERSAAVLAHEADWGERYWKWRADRLGKIDPFAYEPFVHAMVRQDDLVGRLGEIGVPTLVVVGSQDTPFLHPSGILAAGIPDAWLIQIPGAAHQPQLESPAAWLAALHLHLSRTEPPRSED